MFCIVELKRETVEFGAVNSNRFVAKIKTAEHILQGIDKKKQYCYFSSGNLSSICIELFKVPERGKLLKE
ncbi:hypothetical protein FACS1894200_00630 [Spirochaetia bacterium]|nr:hypothetical protein FACS1894200_00630 [Spirochaetia bacterium]